MREWLPLNGYRVYRKVKQTGRLNASPPTVLAGGFLFLIVLGTALLLLPWATHHSISIFEALFTATAAVTVTGMTIVDIGETFTAFGQVVIILMVQIGGLGFVTFAVVAALTLGRKISLKQQALVMEAFNQTSVARVKNTAFAVIRIAAGIQLVGFVVLTLWWTPSEGLGPAAYSALFHTISAFNNAGIALYGDSLTRYVDDPITVLAITTLIIMGGIGFSVLADIGAKRTWQTLRPYTKLILLGTLILNLAGFIIIWALEAGNPRTLGPLSWSGQALAAWLQTVATRTAGFSSVDIGALHDSTTLIMILYMFIGGGSLSTASGIKLGTFLVLVAAAYSYIVQRKEVVLFKRTIAPETVQKSLALLLVTMAIGFTATVLISMLDDFPFINILFEVVAALSTTGLGRDVTAHLSTPSQCIMLFLMFVGRLGPLTLVYNLGTQRKSRVRYPETDIQVG